MSLTVVNDLDTLLIFLNEIGKLWDQSSDKMCNARDRYERQKYIDECKMYSKLIESILTEANSLK